MPLTIPPNQIKNLQQIEGGLPIQTMRTRYQQSDHHAQGRPKAFAAIHRCAPLRASHSITGISIGARMACDLTTKFTGGNGAQRICRPVQSLVRGSHFANTSSEYPPNTLAVNRILNLENSHRGPLAIALLIEGCCLKSPKAAFV